LNEQAPPVQGFLFAASATTERDMKKLVLCLALLAPTLAVHADGALPQDVQTFVDRREGCDHMRGELPDPSEKRRMKEVNREIEKLCRGTDRQLAQLKKKYAPNVAVMQRLNEFEPSIEPKSPQATVPKNGRAARPG
jgi:hypothetical protein